MKNSLLCLMFGFFLITTSLQAQYDEAPNALSVKRTFVNFDFPINGDLFTTDFYSPGLEVEYIRSIGQFFNLALPVKVSEVRLPVDENKVLAADVMASVDLLIQAKYFEKDARFNPYAFGGIGMQFVNMENNLMFPVGIGLNIRILPHVYLTGQTEYRFSTQDFRANIQHGLGMTVILGAYEGEPEDRDGDGVDDLTDQCPDEIGLAALMGCPDRDGDGIADKDDNCPDVAGVEALMGCPDADGDGITDADDECPTTAGLANMNGCPDSDGDGIKDSEDDCPTAAGTTALGGCPDSDGDGIKDSEDKCPDQAGTADNDGCPFKDTDNDGVKDEEDKCPTSAGPASNDGCPEITVEDKEKLEFATQAVEFETGSAIIRQESYAVLDDIVDILNRYPDYNMSIGGHTDSIGSSGTNQTLSENRAKACYDYLVSKGINANRMSWAGYGESQPIADNRYKDGRQKNRRVVFDVYLVE
jgi:OOP family OmpA-OmpF porin